MAESAAPKLKIFATVWWGYSYAFRHIPLAIRAGAPIVLVIFFSIHPIVLVEFMPEGPVFGTLISWLAIPLCAHFAIAWHRSILLGEHAPRIIRFGKPELLYAAVTLLFWLPDIVFSIVGDFFEELPVFSAVSIVLYLVISVAILFAAPILPALAIGDHAMTVPTIWRQLRGNWVRFLFIDIVAVAGSLLIFFSSLKVISWVEAVFWAAVAVDSEKISAFGMDFMLMAISGAFSSAVLAVAFVVLLAANVGTLSIIYAGIVRRTLASRVDYVAVDRLAARFVTL